MVFPAMIIVPSALQVVHAQRSTDIIYPDSDGNVVVKGNFDELSGSDWTVYANGEGKKVFTVDGGTIPSYSVKIKSGAELTGDQFIRNGVVVTTQGYTIENSGSLNVGNYGILADYGNTIVQNKSGGLIQGGNVGINFSNERIWVDSLNLLGNDVEVEAPGNTVINSGSIIGSSRGIYSGGYSSLTVENQTGGTITGNYGSGIETQNGLVVTNAGSIIGGAGTDGPAILTKEFFRNGSGISTGFGANITNSGIITGMNGDGISAYDSLVLENSGSISGLGDRFIDGKGLAFFIGGGSGVSAGSNAMIVNQESGNITGINYGIRAGNNLNLTNYGTITVSNSEGGYAGVSAYGAANIQNYGTISGGQYGIIMGGDQMFPGAKVSNEPLPEFQPFSTITNSGTITGSQAAIVLGGREFIPVLLDAPDISGGNIVNLDFGSIVNGDIIGSNGNDTINFLSGSKSPKQQENIVNGSVYGIETITKSESGYAFIGGPGASVSVVADTINISGGGLIINGSLISQSDGKTQVILSGDGKLDGTGDWNADISIGSGGLSAGSTSTPLGGDDGPIPLRFSKNISEVNTSSSIGTLTINGNVASALPVFEFAAKAAAPSSGYLRVDVRPQTAIVNGVNSDLINHIGAGNTFDVTGLDIQLAPTDINKTLTDGKYTIVDSENPLVGVDAIGSVGVHFSSNAPDTGSFLATGGGDFDKNTVLTKYFTTIETEDPVKTNTLTTRAAAFDPNNSNLIVSIQHGFENLPGLTKNQAALGAAITGLVNNPSPILQDFIAALDFSDLAAVQATLAALDPSATLGVVNSVVNSNYRLHRLTQEHLASIRGTSRESTEVAPSSKDAKGVITPGPSSVLTSGRGNAWGAFSLDGQDNQGAESSASYDGTSGSFTAGVDWLVAPQLVAGLVLDGSRGNYDADDYSSDVDSFRGALYGTFGGAMGFYSDAIVGFGTHSLDSTIGSAGVLTSSTSNDTDASSFQAMWTAGYTMGDSKVKHGPFGGLEYQKVDVDGYTQGGPLAIQVGSYDVESLRALIGYRVNVDLGKFRPYASAAYAYEFNDDATTTTASLAGVPFSVSTAGQSSAFILTAGSSYILTDDLALDLGYRGDIATDDGITSNGGTIGVNYSF